MGGVIALEDSIRRIDVIDDHLLKLELSSGSIALVNMRRRMIGIRFQALSDPNVFRTVRSDGDFAVWRTPGGELRASVRELLDTMP
jgi:hypothetical protein